MENHAFVHSFVFSLSKKESWYDIINFKDTSNDTCIHLAARFLWCNSFHLWRYLLTCIKALDKSWKKGISPQKHMVFQNQDESSFKLNYLYWFCTKDGYALLTLHSSSQITSSSNIAYVDGMRHIVDDEWLEVLF